MGSRMKVVRTLVIGLAAVSLAAGCGGDEGGSSATEWADDLCSATTTWNESIRSALDSVTAGNLSEEQLRSAADDFESATNDFVDDLRGLGPPETESGEQAQESLDQLAGEIEEGAETIRNAVDEASGVSGIVEAGTTVSTTLATIGQQLTSTFAELEDLDPGGELETAFNEAEACNELESDQG
jgi:ABC-type transporter Mla subunit MlaD